MRAPKTVQQRLHDAEIALAVLVTSLSAEEQGDVDPKDVSEGLRRLALNASAEVYWLMQLPDAVLTLPAPADVRREASERTEADA